MSNRHFNGYSVMIILILSFVCTVTAFSANEPTYKDISEDIYLSEWSNILGLSSILHEAKGSDRTLLSLASENPPDIFMLEADDFLPAKQNGYLYKFKPSSKMLKEYEEMPQIVKNVLSTFISDEDQFYGYPEYIHGKPMMFWVPDAWAASPFKGITPPQSFCELLDFVELYLNTPHDGFCFYYDVFGDNHPEQDWIDRLLACWTIQKRSAGEEVCLDDPEFVSLAERTRDLAVKLSKEEPNKKKQKGRQLFTWNFFGNTENGKDTFSWNNMIPWRITSDQAPLVNYTIFIDCIRSDSSISNRASDLLDVIVDHRKDPYHGEPNYVQYLFINPKWIDVKDENRITIKTEGKKWKCSCMTQEFVDSIWEIHQYAVPCAVNKEYLSSFLPYSYFQRKYQIIQGFTNGNISAEEFATQLDRLPQE